MTRVRGTYKLTVAVVALLAAVTSCTSTTEPARARVTYKVTGSASDGRPATATPDLDTAAQARADLQRLTVLASRPYVPGYQRSCGPGDGCSFGPAWTDDQDAIDGHNGCDTRSDVIRNQMANVVIKAGTHGCYPVSGELHDPYTGTIITWTRANSDTVEIDHVVPLALAWDLGAAGWSQAQRESYANDPSLVLLAVDKASNRDKQDSGPAEWMPADRGYWCAYDQRFVTILARYRLAVTAADKAAMDAILSRC